MTNNQWGWRIKNGVEFFLEPSKGVPPFFPANEMPSGFCPHETSGEPEKQMELGIYFYENGYEFPENVKVERSVIRYTGVGCINYIIPLLSQTNYIPLVVDGLKVDGKQNRFFERLYNEVMLNGRSVVLLGDKDIPLPKFIRRIKNVEQMVRAQSD